MIVSAENSVGLILAPLRILVSAMVPEPGQALAPGGQKNIRRGGVSRRHDRCGTGVIYSETTGTSRKLYLRGPLAISSPWQESGGSDRLGVDGGESSSVH